MQGFFMFLQQNPYLLLFFVVGLAVWIGRGNISDYDKAFQVVMNGKAHTFDSFECAIHA